MTRPHWGGVTNWDCKRRKLAAGSLGICLPSSTHWCSAGKSLFPVTWYYFLILCTPSLTIYYAERERGCIAQHWTWH